MQKIWMHNNLSMQNQLNSGLQTISKVRMKFEIGGVITFNNKDVKMG